MIVNDIYNYNLVYNNIKVNQCPLLSNVTVKTIDDLQAQGFVIKKFNSIVEAEEEYQSQYSRQINSLLFERLEVDPLENFEKQWSRFYFVDDEVSDEIITQELLKKCNEEYINDVNDKETNLCVLKSDLIFNLKKVEQKAKDSNLGKVILSLNKQVDEYISTKYFCQNFKFMSGNKILMCKYFLQNDNKNYARVTFEEFEDSINEETYEETHEDININADIYSVYQNEISFSFIIKEKDCNGDCPISGGINAVYDPVDKNVELENVVVSAEFLRGAGNLFVKKVLQYFKHNNVKFVSLFTYSAENFYAQLGFKVDVVVNDPANINKYGEQAEVFLYINLDELPDDYFDCLYQ